MIGNKNINRNSSTINTKGGYESESEAKSMNSTTTSSTVPFFPTRNGESTGTTKNSARSVSQKNNQSNKRFLPKTQSLEDSTVMSNKDQSFSSILKEQVPCKYQPTKIKIVQTADYSHHDHHRINKALNNYSQFIHLAFRTKGKLNVPAIMSLAKTMGITINKNVITE